MMATTKQFGVDFDAATTPLTGTETLSIVQGGTTKDTTTQDIADLGGGGSTPTGTGFVHVTAGVQDGAAKLVDTADVNNDQITYAKIQNVSATDMVLGRSTAGAGDIEEVPCTAAGRALLDDTDAAAQRVTLGILQPIEVAASDETTALTVGTNKLKFRNPYATVYNVTAVKASLSTAQASGSIFTVDINESGVSILSTKLTIDNTETTSTTAATPPVISDASIAADAEIEIDIDQVGDGTAKGLKVTLIGYPS